MMLTLSNISRAFFYNELLEIIIFLRHCSTTNNYKLTGKNLTLAYITSPWRIPPWRISRLFDFADLTSSVFERKIITILLRFLSKKFFILIGLLTLLKAMQSDMRKLLTYIIMLCLGQGE